MLPGYATILGCGGVDLGKGAVNCPPGLAHPDAGPILVPSKFRDFVFPGSRER
jgi:hypothetical protein